MAGRREVEEGASSQEGWDQEGASCALRGEQTSPASANLAWAVHGVVGSRGEDTVQCRVEAPQYPKSWSCPKGAVMGEGAEKLVSEAGHLREVATQDQHQREQEAEEDAEVQLVQRRLTKSGRRSPKHRSKMDELQILQLELSFVNARASRACARLKKKVETRCKSHLDRRRAVIQRIPGFWAQVMMSHPEISVIISRLDEDLLSYLGTLEVEELKYPRSLYRMTFSFRENPYFQNEVVLKEYQLNITGFEASSSTALQWVMEGEAPVPSLLQDPSRLTFFKWLSGHRCADSNRIAEIIIEDLWANPLDYYPGEGSTRAADAGLERNLCLPDDRNQSPCWVTHQQDP